MNFGPPGQCDTCLDRWDGDNCDRCARGWIGENCTERCPVGWAGTNCDTCEFGFTPESNCTDCIENGRWTGQYHNGASLTVRMTFEGPACTNLEPGKVE